MNTIKRGDVVVITDGSYTESVIDGALRHESLNHGANKNRPYKVVETDCSFPIHDIWQPNNYQNDTVIQDVQSGKVVFIHHRLLALTECEIIIDGKAVKVSSEICLRLRRELGI